MKKASIFLLLLALAGCAPPYNADVNRAGKLTGRMTLIGTAGPVYVSSSNLQITGSLYLPLRPTAAAISLGEVDTGTGFLVGTDGYVDHVQFNYTESGGKMQSSGQNQYSLYGANPDYVPYTYAVGPTSPSAGTMLVLSTDPALPVAAPSATAQLGTGPLPQGSMSFGVQVSFSGRIASLSPPWDTSALVGLSVAPQPTQDFSFWLLKQGANFAEVRFNVDVTQPTIFISPTVPVAAGAPIPSAVARCLYYHDPVRVASYASWIAGGVWQCWTWEAAGANPRQLTGVTHRVDALLSTGELVSFEGDVLRVFDPSGSGTAVVSTPLEGMRFCYETYVGTTAYLFFCQPLSFGYNQWGYRLFALPTSDVRNLE